MENIKYQKLLNSYTKEKCKDTGMALLLILLLVGLFKHDDIYFKAMAPILIINMVAPTIFRPLAWLWFNFSHLLGTVMSKVVLTIIFCLFVIPVGFSRQLIGKDVLSLKMFKKGGESVMKIRNRLITAEDIEKPY